MPGVRSERTVPANPESRWWTGCPGHDPTYAWPLRSTGRPRWADPAGRRGINKSQIRLISDRRSRDCCPKLPAKPKLPLAWEAIPSATLVRRLPGFVFRAREPIMISSTDEREDFHHRPEKPQESICMFCFLTVRASKPELLANAELNHRRECPNRPNLSANSAS